MKYNVGDKVRIRSDLVADNSCGGTFVNSDMVTYCGKICTISEVEGSHYLLEEDHEEWYWTDEMIESKVTPYKVGDKVRIRNDLKPWVNYGSEAFVHEMRPFTGTICTISNEHIKLNGTICYKIKEDGGKYFWTQEMFEPKVTGFSFKLVEADEEPKTAMELEEQRKELERLYKKVTYGAFGDRRFGKQKENKENKEDIEMSKTELIEIKENEEERALDKAEREELKNKFYETPIGKAAKAFNEALNQYGSDEQKANYRIDEDELLDDEAKEYIHEIGDKYDAKRTEIRQYYREAKSLFENADTYEQKHEILTAYGILKGPKAAKTKVEAK